jgi:hypothetical protein
MYVVTGGGFDDVSSCDALAALRPLNACTDAPMHRLRAAGYEQPFTALERGVEDYVCNYLATIDPYR